MGARATQVQNWKCMPLICRWFDFKPAAVNLHIWSLRILNACFQVQCQEFSTPELEEQLCGQILIFFFTPPTPPTNPPKPLSL